LDSSIIERLSIFEIAPELSNQVIDALEQSTEHIKSQNDDRAYKLNITKIEGELARLTDAFLSGLISEDDFKNRKTNYELRKLELSKTYENRQSAHDRLQNAYRFFEHIQSLCQTYISANHSEKRQMLRSAFSNISLDRKNVVVEPKDWLSSPL